MFKYFYITILCFVMIIGCDRSNEVNKLFLKARSLVRDGKTDEAISIFEQIIKEYPSSNLALKADENLEKLTKGNIYSSRKELKGDDGKVEYDTSLASAKKLYSLKKYSQAQIILQDLLVEDAENNEYHYWLGNVYLEQRKMSLALESYTKAASLQNNLASFTLAKHFFVKNDFVNLEQHAKNLLKSQDSVLRANGHIFLAIYKASKGKKEEAKKIIAQVSKSITNFLQVSLFYNYCQGLVHSSENPQKAIEFFFKVMKGKDSQIAGKATLEVAKIYLRRKDPSSAIETLNEISTQRTVKIALVNLLFAEGRNFEAKKLADKIYEGNLDVENAKSLVAFALGYKEIDYAYFLSKNARRKFPKSMFFDTVLADICVQKHTWPLADKYYKTALKKIIDDNTKAKILIRLSQTSMMRRREKEAVLFIKQALEIDPFDLTFHLALARVYLRQRNFEEAIRKYQSIRKLVREKQKQQQLELQILNVYTMMKDWESVYQKSKELMQKFPGLIAAQVTHAIAHHQLGKSEQAMIMYRKLVDKANKGNKGIIANNLASLLADNKLELNYAEKLANLAFSELKIPHALDTLAWVYYQQDRYKESKQLLKKILHLLPQSAYVNYHYALHLVRENKNDEAKKYFTRTLERSDDSFQHYQECRNYLEKL
ncbi:tetratricopeptide repeat protein [Candidatus Uabimicrobium sp. HlEnr_7]|uniref:tetratricopeptide repeat protein n=1 Tax=Candidatus Uabimicrobium helgolandensis TaxID=3095367 RepID=UPI003558921D